MHVIRISWYALFLAEEFGQSKEWCELLYNAAPMHDIGKIGIPDKILLKPGPLDPDEWEIMQKHVDYGIDIIGNHESLLLQMARDVAATHHEHWDGSGYPLGLKGTDIPLAGRILAVVDVYDALVSQRPYKEAWSEEQALEYIEQQSGKHFDPALVPLLKNCLPRIHYVQEQYRDELVVR